MMLVVSLAIFHWLHNSSVSSSFIPLVLRIAHPPLRSFMSMSLCFSTNWRYTVRLVPCLFFFITCNRFAWLITFSFCIRVARLALVANGLPLPHIPPAVDDTSCGLELRWLMLCAYARLGSLHASHLQSLAIFSVCYHHLFR